MQGTSNRSVRAEDLVGQSAQTCVSAEKKNSKQAKDINHSIKPYGNPQISKSRRLSDSISGVNGSNPLSLPASRLPRLISPQIGRYPTQQHARVRLIPKNPYLAGGSWSAPLAASARLYNKRKALSQSWETRTTRINNAPANEIFKTSRLAGQSMRSTSRFYDNYQPAKCDYRTDVVGTCQ